MRMQISFEKSRLKLIMWAIYTRDSIFYSQFNLFTLLLSHSLIIIIIMYGIKNPTQSQTLLHKNSPFPFTSSQSTAY